MSRHILSSFPHEKGEHCGSCATKCMFEWNYRKSISEAMVVGLGSGTGFAFVKTGNGIPFPIGRINDMEENFAKILGLDYDETYFSDSDEAFEDLKYHLKNDNPVTIAVESYYLPYHPSYKRRHFPGHRIVVIGFDDKKEEVYVAERQMEQIQTVSYSALKEARSLGMFPNKNRRGVFKSKIIRHSLKDACINALKLQCSHMLDSKEGPYERNTDAFGLPGLKYFKEVMEQYQQNFSKENHPYSHNSFIIENFGKTWEFTGSGGGNFRKFFAQYLVEIKFSSDPFLYNFIKQQWITSAFFSSSLWTTLSHLFVMIPYIPYCKNWSIPKPSALVGPLDIKITNTQEAISTLNTIY